MKLKLTLLTFCLLGIGLFSRAQDKKTKPVVENGADAIPITVVSKKKHPKPHAEAQYDKDGNLLPAPPPPPPKVEQVRFTPPKVVKDAPPPPAIDRNGNPTKLKAPPKVEKVRFAPPRIVKDPPPPPPKKVSPDAPPHPDERG